MKSISHWAITFSLLGIFLGCTSQMDRAVDSSIEIHDYDGLERVPTRKSIALII